MNSVSKYDPTDEEMEFARASMPIVKTKYKSTSNYDPTEEELDFAKFAMKESEKGELPWYKSYPAAAAKGLTKFARGAVESIRSSTNAGGLEEDVGSYFLKPEEKEKIAKETAPFSEQENEDFSQELDERLPTNEGIVETGIEKASHIAPSALIGPGSLLGKGVRTGAAAVLGTAAKEAGVGETGQTLIEMIPFLTPSLGKKLVAKNAKEQELIDFAGKHGLNEKQTALGLKEDNWWNKTISKLAYKGEKTKGGIKDTKKISWQSV